MGVYYELGGVPFAPSVAFSKSAPQDSVNASIESSDGLPQYICYKCKWYVPGNTRKSAQDLIDFRSIVRSR